MSETPVLEDSPLVAHARRELGLAGLFDADADYGGMLAEAVVELVQVFARQGHSGGSAAMVLHLFGQLADFKALTPLTSEPAEWQDVSEISGYPFWQSRRDPSVFSEDGGKTWYSLDDKAKS